jgi:hypothetical protein
MDSAANLAHDGPYKAPIVSPIDIEFPWSLSQQEFLPYGGLWGKELVQAASYPQKRDWTQCPGNNTVEHTQEMKYNPLVWLTKNKSFSSWNETPSPSSDSAIEILPSRILHF